MRLGLVAVQEDVFANEKVFLENRIFDYCGIYNPANHMLYKQGEPVSILSPTEFTRAVDAIILFSTDNLLSFIELCVRNLKHLYIVNSQYLNDKDIKKIHMLNHEARSVIYPGPVDQKKPLVHSIVKETIAPYLIIIDHHIAGKKFEIQNSIPSPLLLNLDILITFFPYCIKTINFSESFLSRKSDVILETKIDFCNGSYASVAINETEHTEVRIVRICYPERIYDLDLVNNKVKIFNKNKSNEFKICELPTEIKADQEQNFNFILNIFLEKICRYDYTLQNISENLQVFNIAQEVELKIKRSSKLLY